MVEYTEGDEKGVVFGSGVENLVVAQTTYEVSILDDTGQGSASFDVILSHLHASHVEANGDYYFEIDAWPLLIRALGAPRSRIIIVARKKILVASGSDDWPDLSGLVEAGVSLPEVGSNVENGAGLVAGIASRLIPFKSCYDEDDHLVPCEL